MARLHEFHCLSQLTFLRQHHIRTPNCNSSSTSIFKSQLSPPCKHTRIFSNPRERVDNQPTNQPTNQRIKLTHCHPKIPLQRRSNVTTNDDERRRTTTNDDERRRTTTNDDERRRQTANGNNTNDRRPAETKKANPNRWRPRAHRTFLVHFGSSARSSHTTVEIIQNRCVYTLLYTMYMRSVHTESVRRMQRLLVVGGSERTNS